MISAMDHVALFTDDLDAAIDGYTRMLGVAPNWVAGDGGARHAWWQFPNMALDVIAPGNAALGGEGALGDKLRARLVESGPGFWALAFTAPDIPGARQRLTRRGLGGSEPHLTRSTQADGSKRYWFGIGLDRELTAGIQILLYEPLRAGPWPLSKAAAEAPVTGLDHIVIRTSSPDRALGIYGAKLGLDLRLDRSNESWGARQMFFKAGDAVVEVVSSLKAPVSDGPDGCGGLAWRVADPVAAHARMAAAGFDVSEVRAGRKPGTHVFTVRDAPAGIPTLILSAEPAPLPLGEPA